MGEGGGGLSLSKAMVCVQLSHALLYMVPLLCLRSELTYVLQSVALLRSNVLLACYYE